VLVVDDEPELRRLAGKVLARLGVEVVEVATAVAAREVLQQRQVDVVVSDVRMPGESGVSLFRWIAKEQPRLAGHFLFVTGDVDAEELGDIAHTNPDTLLRKPFTLQDLTDRVRAMLSQADSGG
jgi:CheY-like chemotaxis protein